MTDTVAEGRTSTTAGRAEGRERPAKAARPPRSEGQWALGQTEPLNANEVFKQADNALNVRQRIIDTYSLEGFESIPGDDLRGRFRWMGLYTQRRPGIDGGQTATLSPEELDDTHFMMRIRIDSGTASIDQIKTIGEVSTRYARDSADITDRQNIQLHWVRIEDVPAIWDAIEPLGLWTQEACGDCPRVVIGSPLAGVNPDELVDPTPAIDQIKEMLRTDTSLANLPRKFKTSVAWAWDAVPEINDVSFVGVVHPEHGPGFDVLVGGGLSTSAHLAMRLGAWVPLDEIAEVWKGVVEVFRDYGYRRLRNKARLKYLMQDWGAEKFRQILETEYLHRTLIDGPPAQAPDAPIDYVGRTVLKDGSYAVGFAAIAGRVSGTILSAVADAAREAGAERIAFTPLQKLVVLGVEESKIDALESALAELGLHADASPWRKGTMACTGIEYCKLALVNTKGRAQDLVSDLEGRLGDVELDQPLRINLNGCPNSCARIQVADIGLKGMILENEAGEHVEGFQVHLGGHLDTDPVYGRKLRGHKITSDELGDYVERITRAYLAERDGDESFSAWVLRADESVLQ